VLSIESAYAERIIARPFPYLVTDITERISFYNRYKGSTR